MRRTGLLLFAFALAACAELRWHKAGADEAALAQDLAGCQRLAQQRSARMGATGFPPASDPRFGAPAGPTLVEQRIQEQQAIDACMRGKGYALVSVDK